MNRSVPKTKLLYKIFFPIIFIPFIFNEITLSNKTLLSLPNKQFFIIMFLIFTLTHIFLTKKFIIKKDILTFIFLSIVFYYIINMLIFFDTIPTINNNNIKYEKGFFLSYILINMIVIFIYLNFLNNIKLFLLKKMESTFFNILTVHNIFVIFFYITYIVGVNSIKLGVDVGYNIPRGFGFVTEPSLSSMLSLISIIYFLRKSKIKLLLGVLAFFLALSSTGFFITIILTMIYFLKEKNIKLKISVFLMFIFIVIIYFLNLLPNSIYFAIDRIIISLEYIINYFTNVTKIDFTFFHSPRVFNFIESIDVIQRYDIINFLFGRGLASTIYYLNNIKGTYNFYLIQFLIEGGIVFLFLHIILLFVIYKQLWKNRKYFFIILSTQVYWLINGGANFILFYILSFLFYYITKKENRHVSW